MQFSPRGGNGTVLASSDAVVPVAGLEPARCYPLDFESSASANSATPAKSQNRYLVYHKYSGIASVFCVFSFTLHPNGDRIY